MVGRPEFMRFKLFSVVFGIAMFMAAPAFAQTVSPTQDAYSITAARVQEQVQSTQSSGELPFTGLTVGIMVAVALVLLATGILVRRAAAARRFGA
jgi:hypothetical protein